MKKPEEEIVIGPSLGGRVAIYHRFVDGECVQSGIGHVGLSPSPDGVYVEYGPRKENGRHDVRQAFTINAPGSRTHSGANSRAFVDGWDRIYGGKARGSSAAN